MITRPRRELGLFYLIALLAFVLAPQTAQACACGCGVFEVDAGAMRPTGKGGTASIEYDFMNQDRNWGGDSRAPAADNDDKLVRSNFYTAGLQFMFNRSWGVMAKVPVTQRTFSTDEGGGLETHNHAAFGDIRLMGVFSGFSPDMSTGVMFGVKLPNGDYKFSGFDRDTAIGSGSTDVLLGAYHQGALCKTGKYDYFVQGMWDRPVAYKSGYRPGEEFDGAFGVYYAGATIANGKITVAPILQLIGSVRARDGGPAADPDNSGYERLYLSPALEFDSENWKFYGDVEFPLYQRVNGDQLVAPALFKVVLSRVF